MSLYDKHLKESEVSLFFANRYKEVISMEPDKEDKEGDYILKLQNEVIKVQIVSCDNEALPIIAKSQRNEGDVFGIYRNRKDSIISAISKKSSHYDIEVIKEMFLLIHSGNISINHEFIIKEAQKSCKESNYKAIFFIKLPDNKGKTTDPINKGDIIQLK